MLKWITNIAGNINRLNFQRTEVIDLPGLVISADNNIYVACRTSVGIFQTNFRERRPRCTGRKKEICCVVSNYPFLAKTNRTSDNNFTFMKYATNTQWVLCFIFRAIRNFIVKRAEALGSMTIGTQTCITCRKSKDFCEWMLQMFFGCHVRKRLRSQYKFFEEISFIKMEKETHVQLKCV